jgi:hypothetical protein
MDEMGDVWCVWFGFRETIAAVGALTIALAIIYLIPQGIRGTGPLVI